MHKLWGIAVIVTMSWPSLSLAQEREGEALVPKRSLCFRPKRATQCAAFALTEVSWGTTEFGDGGRWEWDVGGLVNLNSSDALGTTFRFGARNVRAKYWGLNVRYRRWFSDRSSIEFSPGVVIVGNQFDGTRLRLRTELSVSVAELGGFARFESTRESGLLGVGGKLGSWPGFVVGVLSYSLLQLIPYT